MRTEEPPPRRSVIGLLLDPAFGGIFWGKLVSSAAIWVHAVVAAILVFDVTGSALAVGVVGMAQFLPPLLLTPWGGALADRGRLILQMIVGRALCAIASGGLALWSALAPDPAGWAAATPLFAGSLLVGFGFVIGGPAQQSIVPRLVTAEELPTAMVLNTAPVTSSRVVGPVIGAFVASHAGAWVAFAVAAGGHLVFVAVLALITVPAEGRRPTGPRGVGAALAHVRAHRSLLMIVVGVAAVGLGGEPALTLGPSLAESVGADQTLVGTLSASFGAGSGVGLVLAALLPRWMSVEVVASGGLGAMALGNLLAAAAPGVPLLLGGLAVAGSGFTAAAASLGTLAQQQSPPALRGRVMALWNMGFLGARPVAGLALGTLADLFNAHVAIAFVGLILALAAWLCRPSRLEGAPGAAPG